jgi:hypothetical protein
MTRKDYVLIAEVLKNFRGDQGDVIDRDKMGYALAEALQADNPNFDRARFLIASTVWDKVPTFKHLVIKE